MTTKQCPDADLIKRLNPYLAALEPASLQALAQSLELVSLDPGATLFRKGDLVDALFIVLDGHLQVHSEMSGSEATVLAEIGPGEPVGEFQILVGGERSNTVGTIGAVSIARCWRTTFLDLATRFDDLKVFARSYSEHRLRRNKLREVLPRLLGSMDEPLLAALEFNGSWQRLRYAEVLFHKGDAADSMSILISGRLRVGAPPRFVAEVAPGEAIGEMGLFLAGDPRSETVMAVRESEVITLSREAFERVGESHPQILSALARLLARRLRAVTSSSAPASARVKNVALIPLGDKVPIGEVTQRLVRGLGHLGTVLHLDRARMNRLLGIDESVVLAATDALNLQVADALEREEGRYDLIVFEAEATATPWTRRCLDQADRVLLVANAASDAEPDAAEKTLMTQHHAELLVHSSLVLLYPNRNRLPSGTRYWLNLRKVDSHYHMCMDREEDFERLARYVAGKAIGVVLSGGGARSTAHLGALQALREAGIPIDMIGGTSGGAAVAVEYALGKTEAEIAAKTHHVMTKVKPLNRFMPPYVALIDPRKMDRVIADSYGDSHIEDLWLPAFCVSCNLSTGDAVVHLSGPLWQAATATAAVPVLMQPVVSGSHLLVDGGVVANMPVEAMQAMGANVIIGSDVSPQEDLTAAYPGKKLPSGWRILWHRLLPFRAPLRAPSIGEIVMRLVTLNDTKTREDARQRCDLLVKPQLESFGMLQFDAIDEMVEQGHTDMQREIDALGEDSPLWPWVKELRKRREQQ
ncbi:MAG: putative acylesterase/phospholipase RssA/CRP-like cAMP-binding protein [Gammaproteobacteria bacterium]|jgi:predicted acylesterase/phospholipase RssA/CRP-like cAMP-binding protein